MDHHVSQSQISFPVVVEVEQMLRNSVGEVESGLVVELHQSRVYADDLGDEVDIEVVIRGGCRGVESPFRGNCAIGLFIQQSAVVIDAQHAACEMAFCYLLCDLGINWFPVHCGEAQGAKACENSGKDSFNSEHTCLGSK